MSLAKSTMLFTMGTLISRVTGLVREMAVLAAFGASGLMDAFFVAFRIPNLLRELLAEGALGSAFTKVYSEISVSDRRRAQDLLIHSMFITLLLSLVTTLIGIIGAPWLVRFLTLFADESGRGAEWSQYTTGLTKILFPYLSFTIVGSVAMGALHYHGRFFLSAVSPIGFNLFYIAGSLWIGEYVFQHGPEWLVNIVGEGHLAGLALGVLLGGIAQLGMQLWGIWSEIVSAFRNLGPLRESIAAIKKVWAIMFPMMIGASAGQVNVLVNTNFATSLQPGAVTWLNAAFRLLQLPIGLFAVAVGSAALPALTRAITAAGHVVDKNASYQLQRAIELVLWLTVPCMVFLAINSREAIVLLYMGGKFDFEASNATAQALYGYSFSVAGYGLIKVFNSFYYAVERTSFTMKVGLFSIALNGISNYLMVAKFGFGHLGLAVTTSITLTINALILAWGTRVHKMEFHGKDFKQSVTLMAISVLIAILIQLAIKKIMPEVSEEFASVARLRALWLCIVNFIVTGGIFAGIAFPRYRQLLKKSR